MVKIERVGGITRYNGRSPISVISLMRECLKELGFNTPGFMDVTYDTSDADDGNWNLTLRSSGKISHVDVMGGVKLTSSVVHRHAGPQLHKFGKEDAKRMVLFMKEAVTAHVNMFQGDFDEIEV